MRRYVVFSIIVTIITLNSGFAKAQARSREALSCGLGLPPSAPKFAEEKEQQALEIKKNGFLNVCDANLDRYHIAFRPLASAVANLAFRPVDLSATPFARFISLGGWTEFDDSERSRLYRGFRTPEGNTVTLFEYDMSVDGSSTWRDPRDEPERINGIPARLSVFQASAGKAISHLSWVERRRAYELWINVNVSGTSARERLFALARSLPPSVPACPNERLPKPTPMGADGFPAHEPMSLTLTEAEVDAMFDKSKRPSK